MPKHIPELLAGCRIEKSNNWSEMLGCVCSCCHAKWFPLIYWRSKKKVGWGVHTSLSVGLVSMWRCTVSKLHVAFHFIVKRHQHLGQLCFLPPSAEMKIQFSYIEVWLPHLFFSPHNHPWQCSSEPVEQEFLGLDFYADVSQRWDWAAYLCNCTLRTCLYVDWKVQGMERAQSIS